MQNWLSLNHSSQTIWAFPRFSLLHTAQQHVFDFAGCLPAFPAASELGVSAPQPQAHSLLCLHIQTPHYPWKNVLTGIYQIPMLSVPFSVLTLGFWGSWFPKRPLTVKLNKGWGRHAGQELLLSLCHSFLVSQPSWHPLPCAGDPLERLQPSVLQHPVALWSVPTLPELPEQAVLYLLLCSQPDYFGATHTRGRFDTSHP